MAKYAGLEKKEVEKNLKKYGYNEIEDINKVSIPKILLRQVRSNLILYLLIAATAISFFVGEEITAYVILAVIFLVVATGFFQEYKAEKAINALKEMIVPISIVIRDGKEEEVPSREIVPGDIIILRNGERIPADCMVLEETDLKVNESVLTGESREVEKYAIKAENSYEEKNIVFTGSFITNGKCIAKAVNTGMNTKFGKIAGLISTAEKELLLQKRVNKISKTMAIVGIIISIITGLIIFFQNPNSNEGYILEVLIIVIAITVSSFPEGFPVVLITTLSLGAYRMAKKNAIVNRMSIIETLGETTVICSDKTGTITKGEMTAKELYANHKKYSITGVGYEANGGFFVDEKMAKAEKDPILNSILKTAILCNDARIIRKGEDKLYHINGSPTEAALLIMSAKENIFSEDINHERLEEIPFSSERKMMSVLCKETKEKTLYAKGALNVVFEKCSFIERDNGTFKLIEKDKKRIKEVEAEMASRSLRIVALAYKKVKNYTKDDLEKELVFLGLVGMEDPPRPEVKEALVLCKKAGIKVKMITGDDKKTAMSIAAEIGLAKGTVIEGDEMDKISDPDLVKIVNQVVIFARVKPEHKLRIVKALKENKEIVTMTGDGVNDAPALKEAHIGVAMGKNGTDVSRSVADLTLKDDNFVTIVDAIKEGRTIFNNARKFISYQLSCNYAELAILLVGVILAPVLGWPVPILLALHILFMNLVTDDLPAITLGFNASSKDIMEEKPRKKSELLNKKFVLLIAFNGFIMAFLTLMTFYVTYNLMHENVSYARSSALVGLIALEIAGAFNFRSFRKGVMNRSPLVNKWLLYASIISILATLAIIYTPLNIAFETSSLHISDWVVAIGLALGSIVIFDILKYYNNRKKFWDYEKE
jgi:Ca2+-transporting ATPase